MGGTAQLGGTAGGARPHLVLAVAKTKGRVAEPGQRVLLELVLAVLERAQEAHRTAHYVRLLLHLD